MLNIYLKPIGTPIKHLGPWHFHINSLQLSLFQLFAIIVALHSVLIYQAAIYRAIQPGDTIGVTHLATRSMEAAFPLNSRYMVWLYLS
ncbi:MAG: hypothetical protein ACOX0Q_11020 [Syntrophomonadaceae bacterium]